MAAGKRVGEMMEKVVVAAAAAAASPGPWRPVSVPEGRSVGSLLARLQDAGGGGGVADLDHVHYVHSTNSRGDGRMAAWWSVFLQAP